MFWNKATPKNHPLGVKSSLKALIRTQSPTKPTKPATKPTKAPTQQRESTTQLTPMMLPFFYGSSLKMKRFCFVSVF